MLLRKTLKEESFFFEKEVHAGISLVPGTMEELLERTGNSYCVVHLVENGEDAYSPLVRDTLSEAAGVREGIAVVLSDRLDLSQGEEKLVSEISDFSMSMGPTSLQTHQVITVFHNMMDRLAIQ